MGNSIRQSIKNSTANISNEDYLTLNPERIILPGSYLRKKYLTKCIVDKVIHIAL